MPNTKYFRYLIAAWFVVGLMAIALSVWLADRNNKLEQASQELSEAMLDLERSLGYAGFIHAFKNHILRPEDPQYRAEAMQQGGLALAAIEQMELAARHAGMDVQFSNLRDTLGTYMTKLDIATKAQARGDPIVAVDQLVRVGDRIATEELVRNHANLQALIDKRQSELSVGRFAGLVALIGVVTGGGLAFLRLNRLMAMMQLQGLIKIQQKGFLDAQLDQERRHSLKLQNLIDQLNTTNRQQAEFAYAISHDLKSPTNTARMLIDHLEEDLLNGIPADQQDLIDDLRSVIGRMSLLIDDTLQYTQTLGSDIPKTDVNLNEVIRDILHDLRADITQSGAKITCGSLPVVHAAPAQMRQLFQNLISNALKFQDPGECPVIKISQSGPIRDGMIEIDVRDNGIGIALEDRDRVFALFGRLHTRDVYDGTGLGLPISRRIAMAHGGDIQIRSPQSRGTVFSVLLEARDQDRTLWRDTTGPALPLPRCEPETPPRLRHG